MPLAPTRARAMARRVIGTTLGTALQQAGTRASRRDGSGGRRGVVPPACATVHVQATSAERLDWIAHALHTQLGVRVGERMVHDAGLGEIDWNTMTSRIAIGEPLLLIETWQPVKELASFARRHCARWKQVGLVLITTARSADEVDSLLAAGARAVVPREYTAETLACALRLVLAGQRFRPYLRARRPAAVKQPETPRPVSAAIDHQADKPLSTAELDVCRLVAQHLSDREIADIRGTGRGTVRSQVTSLMRKLGCKRRDEAGEIYRRLYEIDDAAVQHALRGETVNLDWLLEFMEVEHARKGDVLFRRGQTAKKLYYIESGEVRLPEIGAQMKAGVLFGEIGIFAPDHKRMHTAECATDVRLRSLDAARVWRYYQLKPQFAVQVLCLITRRLLADINRLRP